MQPQPSTPTPPQTAAPLPSNPAGERRALSRVIWYAILNLVGEVAGFVLAFAVFMSMVASGVGFYPRTSIGPSGPTPQQAQGMLQAFRYLTLLVPFGVLFGLIAVILLWVGFRGLSKAGASEFSLPSKLLLCSVVAFVLQSATGEQLRASPRWPKLASLMNLPAAG